MKDETIELLLCAQITSLAYQIKKSKERYDPDYPYICFGAGNCINEAIRLIQEQQPEILRLLSETHRQYNQ
ncbi:hypothetical protein QKZ77_004923 [Salmonella enterica]|nr:hypothetical protein [Salmonella enterica]